MSVPKAETKSPLLRKKKKLKWTRDDTELTLLATPTIIWYILFCYLPMFGVILAFKDYKIVNGARFFESLIKSQWVGFENFKYFFNLRDFPMILRNTVLYNLVFIVLDIVLPVGLAMMISNIYSKRKSKVYQTLMFMWFWKPSSRQKTVTVPCCVSTSARIPVPRPRSPFLGNSPRLTPPICWRRSRRNCPLRAGRLYLPSSPTRSKPFCCAKVQ